PRLPQLMVGLLQFGVGERPGRLRQCGGHEYDEREPPGDPSGPRPVGPQQTGKTGHGRPVWSRWPPDGNGGKASPPAFYQRLVGVDRRSKLTRAGGGQAPQSSPRIQGTDPPKPTSTEGNVGPAC